LCTELEWGEVVGSAAEAGEFAFTRGSDEVAGLDVDLAVLAIVHDPQLPVEIEQVARPECGVAEPVVGVGVEELVDVLAELSKRDLVRGPVESSAW
jgi:hypothetical protein